MIGRPEGGCREVGRQIRCGLVGGLVCKLLGKLVCRNVLLITYKFELEHFKPI